MSPQESHDISREENSLNASMLQRVTAVAPVEIKVFCVEGEGAAQE